MSQFAEYVTSTAFNLSLSKRMIEALCWMNHYGNICASTATVRSLEARGLIERKVPNPRRPDGPNDDPDAPWIFSGYAMSEAGKAVIPLLKLCGLFTSYPPTVPPEVFEGPKIKLKIDREEYIHADE